MRCDIWQGRYLLGLCVGDVDVKVFKKLAPCRKIVLVLHSKLNSPVKPSPWHLASKQILDLIIKQAIAEVVDVRIGVIRGVLNLN